MMSWMFPIKFQIKVHRLKYSKSKKIKIKIKKKMKNILPCGN